VQCHFGIASFCSFQYRFFPDSVETLGRWKEAAYLRKSLREQLNQSTNAKLMGLDLNDFMAKASYLEDSEMASEFGMTRQQILDIKNKLGRS
jgi:hypothetical protein